MNTQPKLKKDGTPKKSGGARTGSGVKSRLTNPEIKADWDAELKRAICTAAANFFVLKHKSFYSIRELQLAYGKPAIEEFKEWFEAKQHFDQEKADALYQRRAMGRITDEQLQKSLRVTAFFWVWSIKPSHQKQAWEMSRGIKRNA